MTDNEKTSYQISKDQYALVNVLIQLHPESIFSWDDKGFGALFADVFRDECRYNTTAKSWMYYNGIVWTLDEGGMIVSQKAKQLADALLTYSATLEDGRQKTDYIKVVAKYGQLRYRETMIKDARDACFISQTDLDKNLDLFNCRNGTYNLKTGEFLPHSPHDLLSKCSNVIFDPEARSPLFKQFISDVMQGNKAKIHYLQSIFGYFASAQRA